MLTIIYVLFGFGIELNVFFLFFLTYSMNSLFKPYLPVDGEGFVTVDNIDDVLDMEYSHTKLAHCIRKSEELATSSASGQVGEVIVLTDDEPGPEPEPEPDYDSFSNPGTSSMASSHQDDMSSDSDSQSVSSIYGIRSSTSQNVIETVSIDSPSSLRKSSSDSFGNFNWKMDEASTTVEAKSVDAMQNEEHTISMETAINDKAKPKLNGDTSENLSTLDESLFDRLVKDINSTHLSLPSNGSISSDVDVMQNGNQSQNDEDNNEQNKMGTNENDILSNNAKNQVPVVCDVLDNFNKGTVNSITEVHPIVNGETELIDDERPNQHLNADEKLNENCDNEVNTILKGHEETLKNIEEIILTDDLKKPSAIPSGSGSSNENSIQNIPIIPQKTFVDTACSPLIFQDEEERKKENEIEMEEVVKEPVVESIVDNPSVNEPIDEVYNEIVVGDTCELVDTPTSDLMEEYSKDPLTMLSDEPEELVEPIVVPDAVGTVNEPPNGIAISNELPIETVIINDPPFVIDVFEAVGKEPRDWVPAAESTVSVLSETSLLTKSEQDILFKDRESGEIFSELFINGPPPIKDAVEKPSEDTLSQISSDSPLTFLVNGLDPNFKLKTYSRKNRKPKIDTKTISTQTISTQTCSSPQSARVSPVITIDDSMKTDKEILIDDDEQFLSDIFSSTDPQVGTGNISKVRSPKTYLASTPASKPLRTYAAKRPATQLTSPVISMTPKMDGIVYTIKPIEKPVEDSRKFGMIEPSLLTASINNQENAIETPPGVVKRKRGRPRKYPLLTPATTDVQQPAVEVPKKEPKKRGRKPKPKDPLPLPPSTSESVVEPKVLRPRRIKAKRISIFQDVLKIKSPTLRRLTISRRFSKVFSLADTPKLATILRRLTYNKSINSSRSFTNKNYDSTLSSSSTLYSSAYRLNGQKKANDSPATNKETTVQTNEPKETNDSSMFSTPSNPITLPTKPSRPTILERKNYLKSNQTSSPMASALKFSPHSAKYNHNSPQRIRHINRIQRYSRIDLVTNHIRRRERKKSVKNTNPRVLVKRIDLNSFRNLNVSEIPRPLVENKTETTNATDVNTNDVQNSTALVVDLTDDDEMQLSLFGPSMNSTQETSYFNSMHSNKRRHSRSNDTETDMTNEFTTDQESNVEDGDDSTRKSKRSRKRPKILDL